MLNLFPNPVLRAGFKTNVNWMEPQLLNYNLMLNNRLLEHAWDMAAWHRPSQLADRQPRGWKLNSCCRLNAGEFGDK